MGMAQPRQSMVRKKRQVRSIRVSQPAARHRAGVLRRKSRLGKNLFLSFTILLAFCLSGLLLIRYTQITQLNNSITAITQDISELKATRDVLVSALEPYKSTQRIERLASTHLGMSYPTKGQVFLMDTKSPLRKEEKESSKEGKYAIIDGIRSIFSVGYHGK